MKRIDGAGIAQKVHEESKQRIASLAKRGLRPGLAVILVGDDPASATYVKMKGSACRRVGMDSRRVALSETTTTALAPDVSTPISWIRRMHPNAVHETNPVGSSIASLATLIG